MVFVRAYRLLRCYISWTGLDCPVHFWLGFHRILSAVRRLCFLVIPIRGALMSHQGWYFFLLNVALYDITIILYHITGFLYFGDIFSILFYKTCFDSLSEQKVYDMEDNLCRSFVSDFLETEEKFLTLVEAYKNQPQLWNLKEYPYVRSSTERNTYFTNIANELRNKLNVQVPNDYIRVAIYRLRQCYRNKCANSGASGEENEGVRSAKARPKWYFSKLKFLEPFLCKNSIDKLDTNQPYLQENQIKKLLNLYERYPHLWNTNLIESVCKNKRNASLKQLAETIHSEMGLKVSEFSLKKYLNGLHFRFCKEKTNVLKADGTPLHSSVYYEHMKFLFDHVGPFYCSECSRKYRNPLHLKAHKCQSHGCERLSCPQCGKQFEQVEPYVAHARRHMNDLNEKCTVCGKMFLRKADLKLHMRSHTGDKPYFCETCGARFAMPTALQQHRKRHTKDYKCHCPICSKPFYTNDHMKRHLETKHSDVRNFECQTCGKAFKTKKTLMGHESTHEEGRKYPCPLCGKMYKNTIGVSQHLRIHRAKIETKSNPLFNQ
ncbi:uncharacterized protein LOC142228868 [Haematobia irritans]|uniref:uncharacterized protein LOC142228868 n=1 Tax=Haematobia irritans TaxID=7368 RepID=UPI003F4FF466